MFKCRRIRNHQLHVEIKPVKKEFNGKNKVVYRITIDGDDFWADTYDHAIHCLFSILLRDEVSQSKIC